MESQQQLAGKTFVEGMVASLRVWRIQTRGVLPAAQLDIGQIKPSGMMLVLQRAAGWH